MERETTTSRGMSRRRFIAGAGALAGTLAWARVERVSARELGTAPPPGFPPGIELSKQRFESWSGEVVVDDLWTATPAVAGDVVAMANWAHAAGRKLRPRGHMHNSPPMTVTPGTDPSSVVLVDTSRLAGMAMVPGAPEVRVGTGAVMEDLLAFLHRHGFGLASVPAIGQVSVGGVLAIDGHGAVVRARGERPTPGEGIGSVSNQVRSVTAVVWDDAAAAYALRTFDRSDPAAAALLVHVGRAFLTEVVLQVGPARNLRCRSYTDIPSADLFAPPERAGRRSFAGFLDRDGRAEAIWFPFTDRPWFKVWSVTPTMPLGSRPTVGPYNYPFSDSYPNVVSQLVDQAISGPGPHDSVTASLGAPVAALTDRVLAGDAAATPLLGQAAYLASTAGLAALGAGDLWGPAFHTQLYIKWTTLRFAQVGFVVHTSRANVQAVVHAITTRFSERLTALQAAGLYPINGPLELRMTGLDHPGDAGSAGAPSPTLSALHPRDDHPEWDTAVWTNVLTFPGTPGSYDFFTEFEAWARETFVAPDACVRVEWAKGWAYTPSGPWTDDTMIGTTIADDHRMARPAAQAWDSALATLNALDPHRVYSNPFLDRLLP